MNNSDFTPHQMQMVFYPSFADWKDKFQPDSCFFDNNDFYHRELLKHKILFDNIQKCEEECRKRNEALKNAQLTVTM